MRRIEYLSISTMVLALAAAAPARAQFKSATLTPLSPSMLQPLSPRVKAIRAEPSEITLHVGQTIQLSNITVVVTDSLGKELGRIIGFDFGTPPGAAAVAVPQKITGVRAGSTVLTIHYPGAAWKMRSDPRPATVVKIIVKP